MASDHIPDMYSINLQWNLVKFSKIDYLKDLALAVYHGLKKFPFNRFNVSNKIKFHMEESISPVTLFYWITKKNSKIRP